ncbi:hypothetical protein [Neolewinella agarilytica]|uniref:Uncharacterized protein n=1 Tax=Neolewinella agarilytica TaxID=478744 RepID=A0A1H9LZG0_9BACT|nr:hypothetical protein [Neolewinella agarilytica]SER16798.1 hypothetical protein SAMN05444359_12651 [Neolewinella agarilytica]
MTLQLLESILYWLKLLLVVLCCSLVAAAVAAYISLNARLDQLESGPTIELSDNLIWSLIQDTTIEESSELGGFRENLTAALVVYDEANIVPELSEMEIINFKRAIDMLNPRNINFKLKLVEFLEGPMDVQKLMAIFDKDPLQFDLIFALIPQYGSAEEPLFLVNGLDIKQKLSLIDQVPRNLPATHLVARNELDSLWNVEKLALSIGNLGRRHD